MRAKSIVEAKHSQGAYLQYTLEIKVQHVVTLLEAIIPVAACSSEVYISCSRQSFLFSVNRCGRRLNFFCGRLQGLGDFFLEPNIKCKLYFSSSSPTVTATGECSELGEALTGVSFQGLTVCTDPRVWWWNSDEVEGAWRLMTSRSEFVFCDLHILEAVLKLMGVSSPKVDGCWTIWFRDLLQTYTNPKLIQWYVDDEINPMIMTILYSIHYEVLLLTCIVSKVWSLLIWWCW